MPTSPSNEFSQTKDLTSTGRPKATASDCFPSYEMYRRVAEYLLSNGQIRDWALLTIGIATGLRVSDLVGLKIGHLYTRDEHGHLSYLDCIDIFARKTGKRTKTRNVDSVLITEAVYNASDALIRHYETKGLLFNLEDYLFRSPRKQVKEYIKKNGKLQKNPFYGEYVLEDNSPCRIFKKVGDTLELGINFGSHTMKHTHVSLVYRIGSELSERNPTALEYAQIAAAHTSSKTTIRYLGMMEGDMTVIRELISDWLLGRIDLGDLTASGSADEVRRKLSTQKKRV